MYSHKSLEIQLKTKNESQSLILRVTKHLSFSLAFREPCWQICKEEKLISEEAFLAE